MDCPNAYVGVGFGSNMFQVSFLDLPYSAVVLCYHYRTVLVIIALNIMIMYIVIIINLTIIYLTITLSQWRVGGGGEGAVSTGI